MDLGASLGTGNRESQGTNLDASLGTGNRKRRQGPLRDFSDGADKQQREIQEREQKGPYKGTIRQSLRSRIIPVGLRPRYQREG